MKHISFQPVCRSTIARIRTLGYALRMAALLAGLITLPLVTNVATHTAMPPLTAHAWQQDLLTFAATALAELLPTPSVAAAGSASSGAATPATAELGEALREPPRLALHASAGGVLESAALAPAAQAATDIDLITNISSDKSVVLGGEPIIYTVVVENRGPATATNADWKVTINSAAFIANTACVASGGATCPASFSTTATFPPQVTSTIPTIPADGVVTLTFEAKTWSTTGDSKSISTVTANGQTDANTTTNEADINISVIPALLSYGINKTIARYENAAGTTVVTPASGNYVIYNVVITNNGVDDIYNLSTRDRTGVETGTGTVPAPPPVRGTVSLLSGFLRDFYAIGTTLESITCVGTTNGATCPADITYTEQTLDTDAFAIPYMPGRTRAAVGNPAGNPVSTVTLEVRERIGQVQCSTNAGTYRTIVNEASVSSTDNGFTLTNVETAGLGAPYGPGDSSDNTSTVRFNVNAPVCPQYDIATQITHSATQAGSGVDANAPYAYTVTVTNNGPDTVSNMPFVFGLHDTNSYFTMNSVFADDGWVNFPTIDENISCVASGGAVCPTGYTYQQQETDGGGAWEQSSGFYWPDSKAIIPSMPSGGTLVFSVTGTMGELNICGRPQDYRAYAHALPNLQMGETNIEIPTTIFEDYYQNYNGINNPPAGSYYGNNGYSLWTQWNTGVLCNQGNEDFDLSVQLLGPYANPNDATPIAGPVAPGQLVYFRARVANLDDGNDILDFIDPAVANPLTQATAGMQLMWPIPGDLPAWLDGATGGWGNADANYFHPLDPLPGSVAYQILYPDQYVAPYSAQELDVPWAALQEVGVLCQNTTGGAQCPDTNEETLIGNFAGFVNADGSVPGNVFALGVPTAGYVQPEMAEYELGSLHLPLGATMEFVAPYRMPSPTVGCVPGGEIYTWRTTDRPGAFIDGYAPETHTTIFDERTLANNESYVDAQIEIPACVTAIQIDKQIVSPAASNILPASGLVQYTIDLTYPAAATQALDVARFTDTPTVDCSNSLLGSGCVNWEIVSFDSCTVTSGSAVCPTQLPIGQQLAQNGTQTPIAAGAIDTSWGTPNATSVANGAAFNPGSSIRITLTAQASNEVSPIAVLHNEAAFASDPASSLFGGGLYTEDAVSVSPPSPDSMVMRKQVSPSDAQRGETIVYTVEIINNGPSDGQGAVLTDALPADLLTSNPAGFANWTCTALTTAPPLFKAPNTADCANVTVTNNGAAGIQVEMTGSWPLNSGYRFTFEAIAPDAGVSVDNTAVLTPPPATSTQRFGVAQDSTTNVRTPDTPSLAMAKVLNTPQPIYVGQVVSFSIIITNTGTSPVATIPLTDTYDTDYLSYYAGQGATLAPDDDIDDGQLNWSDVTGANDLGPGEVVTITVPFVLTTQTSSLGRQAPCTTLGAACNLATISDSATITASAPISGSVEAKSTLGDYVWYDVNSNGLKDDGDTGINGVLVNLYVDGLHGNPLDGIAQPGEYITSTTTAPDAGGIGDDTGTGNLDGYYDFAVSDGNIYIVEIDAANFALNGALEGYIYTGDNGSGSAYNGPELRVISDLLPTGVYDYNDADFPYGRPNGSLAVRKVLNTPEALRINDVMSFTIIITNTSNVTLTAIPLEDRYSSLFMNYQSAAPAPMTTTAGILQWTNVAPGAGLAPSDTVSVDVYFTAQADTTLLNATAPCIQAAAAPNLARVQNALAGVAPVTPDTDDTSCDSVQILNPTGVQLAARSLLQTADGVLVRWQTSNESSIRGFRVWRVNGVTNVERTHEMIVAKVAGQSSGANYTWLDAKAQLRAGDVYLLEISKHDGTSEYVIIDKQAGIDLFLPLVAR